MLKVSTQSPLPLSTGGRERGGRPDPLSGELSAREGEQRWWAAIRVGDFSLALIPAWSWEQAAGWAGVRLCDVCLHCVVCVGLFARVRLRSVWMA